MGYGSGRKMCMVREAWVLRFNIEATRPHRLLNDKVMCQLSMCRSDEARRLILGVSIAEDQELAGNGGEVCILPLPRWRGHGIEEQGDGADPVELFANLPPSKALREEGVAPLSRSA